MNWNEKFKGELIDSGSYGEIYEITSEKGNLKSHVIKVLADFNEEDRRRIIREINCLLELKDNENVIDILDYCKDAPLPWFLMPKADCNLNSYIYDNGPINDELCIKITKQILNAIGEAHKREILHRDLGASNILLFVKDKEIEIKVADFSLGRDFKSSSKALTRRSTKQLGQDAFVDPKQLINFNNANETSDIYAIGSLMSYMLSGEDPRLVQPTHSDLYFIISKCRDGEQGNRPQTIEEVFKLIQIYESRIKAGVNRKSHSEINELFINNNDLQEEELIQLTQYFTKQRRLYDSGDLTYNRNIESIVEMKDSSLLGYWIKRTDNSSVKNFINNFIEQALRIRNQVRWSFRDMKKIGDVLLLVYKETYDNDIKVKIYETLCELSYGFGEVTEHIQYILTQDYGYDQSLLTRLSFVTYDKKERIEHIFREVEGKIKHFALIEPFDE